MKRFRANSYNFWRILLLLSKANAGLQTCKPDIQGLPKSEKLFGKKERQSAQ